MNYADLAAEAKRAAQEAVSGPAGVAGYVVNAFGAKAAQGAVQSPKMALILREKAKEAGRVAGQAANDELDVGGKILLGVLGALAVGGTIYALSRS